MDGTLCGHESLHDDGTPTGPCVKPAGHLDRWHTSADGKHAWTHDRLNWTH